MEYTKNYKLPQWELEDRIQMEDFNAAMENIEKGLNGQEELTQETQEKLWDGVLRISALWMQQKYDALGDEEIKESNLYLNPLTTETMADTLSGPDWNTEQKIHIGRVPELSRTDLRKCCTYYTTATTTLVYTARESLYEFTSPVNGKVWDFDLIYYFFFSESYASFTGGSLTFTAYEKQDGSYVSIYQKPGISLSKTGTSTTEGSITIPVEVPLKKGASYRFSLHLDSGEGVIGRVGLVTGLDNESGRDDSQFTIESYPVTEGSHSRVMPTQRGCTHTLVMAEFQQEEEHCDLVVTLDGVPLAEVERVNEETDGGVVRKVTYSGANHWEAHPTLTITMGCSGTDQLSLTKYGALFL